MSSHSPFHLGGVLRNIRSFLPRSGNSEEKFNFVRFTDETELNTLSNGSISKEGTPGDEKGGSLEYTNGSVAKLEDQSDEGAQARQRNQISALQAGWNVTNAIQVSNYHRHHHHHHHHHHYHHHQAPSSSW